MQEVAKSAGVSPMTVSNVINGYPHVSEKTKKKVNEAIDRLGYRVNIAARNLRSGRTGTIGLSVPELDRPYFGQLAAQISAAANDLGFRVAVEQTGATRDLELAALQESKNRKYDGLILSAVALGPEDADLLKVDFPVVVLGERIFAGPADHIAMPNVEGMQLATLHLIQRGCKKIAMLGGPYAESGSDVGSLRLQGYELALRSAGRAFDPSLVIKLPAFTMSAGADSIPNLLREHPDVDGIACITDTVAVGVIRALHNLGKEVPEDIKVVGFDALDESAFMIPSLTTVDPNHKEMAERAVKMLVERIRSGAEEIPPREIVSKFELRLGESTESR